MVQLDQIISHGLANLNPSRGRWIDLNRQFDPKPVNEWLRREHQRQNPAVSGDTRHGYCIKVDGVTVGVTNGYGQGFRVFVRQDKVVEEETKLNDPNYIPFNGECVFTSKYGGIQAEYGLQPEF